MLLFIIIILVLVAFLTLWPVKRAVHLENIQSSSYYIIEPIAVTGFNWKVIGSHEGEKLQDVIMWGSDPNIILSKSLRMNTHNTYVVYGELSHNYVDENVGEFSILFCRNFDIVVPIERDSLRFFPKSYLVPLDYLWFNR